MKILFNIGKALLSNKILVRFVGQNTPLFQIDKGNKFDSTDYVWYKNQEIVGTIDDGKVSWHK